MNKDPEQSNLNQQETEVQKTETLAEKIARLKQEKEEKEKADQEAASAKEAQEKVGRVESLQNEKAQLEQALQQTEQLTQEITAINTEVVSAKQALEQMIQADAELLAEMGITSPEDMASNDEFKDTPEVVSWLQKQSELEQKNAELDSLSGTINPEKIQIRLTEINQELTGFEQAEKAKEDAAKQEQVNKMAQEFPFNRPLDKAKELILSGKYDESMVKEAYLESIRMNHETNKQAEIKDNPAEAGRIEDKYKRYLDQDIRTAEREWNIMTSDLFEEQNNTEIESYLTKISAKSESPYLNQTITELKLSNAINIEDPIIKEARFTINGDVLEIGLDLPRLKLEIRDKEGEIKKVGDKMLARQNAHNNYKLKLMDRSYEGDMAKLQAEKTQLEAERSAIITEYNRRNGAKNEIDSQVSRMGRTSKDWIIKNRQLSFSEILFGLEKKAEEDSQFNPTDDEKQRMTDKINKRLALRKAAGKNTY